MKNDNPITLARRIRELLIDYAVILGYLLLLFIVFALIYNFVIGQIPIFTKIQAHLIATLTSVIPIIFLFSVFDYKKPYGSIGKRDARLTIHYKNYSFSNSLLRNIIKFLPWQLGHMGTIEGMYTEFNRFNSYSLTILSLLLAGVLLGMGLFRKDKRHLGDFLAGTQVVLREDAPKHTNNT